MNPDFDDFDDVPQQPSDEPRSRALPRLVVVVAIAGFVALAWYAYQSGSDSMRTGEIEFVEADSDSYKEKPAEPGGEEFPHKDKTIYDAISPYAADDAPKVEKLLPEPEQPVKPVAESKASDTWVSDAVREKEEPSAPVQTKTVEDAAIASAIAASEKTAAQKSEELSKEIEKSIESAEPIKTAAPVEAKPAEVKPVEVKSVEVKNETVKPVPVVTPVPKPVVVEKPAVSQVASSGVYKIQLGAYKTEAEAKQTASRIISKNGDVLSGKPQFIVKADLPNGTFYRLRFGGFTSPEAAKAACGKLSGRGQGCFYAGK